MSTTLRERLEALPRSERLLARNDFRAVQSRGKKLHGEHFVLLLLDRADGGPTRLGITTSRKVGNSVVRHRVKRWVREVFRRNKSVFPAGCDLVVIAREGKVPTAFEVVRLELIGLVTEKRRPRHGLRDGTNERRGGTGARAQTDAKHRGR